MAEARRCIQAKIRAGKIDPGRGTRYLADLDRLEQAHGQELGTREAARLAAGELAQALQGHVQLEKRRLALKILAVDRAEQAMAAHPNGVYEGAKSLLVHDRTDVAQGINVEAQRLAIQGRAHALFAQGLEAYRSTWAGLKRDKAGPRAMVRELYGEDSGNAAAKSIAQGWDRTAEWLRQRFNRAGGDIAARADWRLPQRHDPLAVGRASADAWAAETAPLLDRAKMRDPANGAPLTDFQLGKLLKEIHEEIRTDGWSGRRAGAAEGEGMLANRHGKARTLVFKDAEAWLTYAEKYGGGDVTKTLTRHIDGLAQDIAMMEVLGPNPAHLQRWLQDRVKQAAATAPGPDAAKALDRANGQANRLQLLYDDLSGFVSTPVSARLALAGQELRAGLVAAQLGGAFLSSLGDVWTHAMTRAFNGLPVAKLIPDYLKFALGKDAQVSAVQLGLGAQGWAKIAGEAGRMAGESFTQGKMAHVADFTMRASLLEPFTQAGQWAFGMEFLGSLARNAGRRLDELPTGLARAFERYGIGAAEWDLIRAAPLRDIDGAKFVHVESVARQGPGFNRAADDAAMALMRMVLSERDIAVIMPGAETRAMLRGVGMGGQSGSWAGEAGRLFGMYKSFPVTLLTVHWQRALNQASFAGQASYGAALFGGLTLFGMLAWQAKQLARGKDAVTMDPTTKEGRAAWGAAMLQGGGIGIAGDFLFADQNRFGHGVPETIAGPAAGFAADVVKLTVGNVQQALRGEKLHLGPELVAFAGRYAPGSSLWYARAAFERIVLDQLSLLSDPDARSRLQRLEQKARKEYGQEFWWKPGQALPDRAPGLSKAIGGTP